MAARRDRKARQRPETILKALLAVNLLCALAACSTMNPVEMSPEEVQMKITSDDILPPGKRTKIVTSDGKIWNVRVARIDADAGAIETDSGNIRIAQIVAVETRDLSIGKTALLAAGSYAVLGLIAMAVAPVFLL